MERQGQESAFECACGCQFFGMRAQGRQQCDPDEQACPQAMRHPHHRALIHTIDQ
jgi:hypothetical protein